MKIEIDDFGPIEHATIPVPGKGGVVLLRGANGSGKTHALAAVNALVTGKGRPPVRDGADSGRVEGCGVRLTVGRKASRAGELCVHHVDGEDPSILIDPKLKDAAAADRKRIEALCRLAGVKGDPQLFHTLVGGAEELAEIARPSTLAERSLPDMAAKLKRDLEQHARAAESAAENAEGKADGLRGAWEGVKIGAEADPDVLSAALEDASRALVRARDKREHADHALEQARRAQERLDQEQGERPDLADLEAQLCGAEVRAAEIREQLDEAEMAVRLQRQELEGAVKLRRALDGWLETIHEAEQVERPDDEELERLAAAERTAREQATRGEVVRRALAAKRAAQVQLDEATAHASRAERLRAAARETETVLSTAIAGLSELRVEGGRLVLDTDRGVEPLAELSFGERARLAIGIAAKAAEPPALFVVAQEFWEGLDPSNEQEIANIAHELGVVILAAVATDGPLRAEVLAP